MMENYIRQLGRLYVPEHALLIYKSDDGSHSGSDVYVEAYDFNKKGQPVNAHPLSLKESRALATALDTSEELSRSYLKAKALLPKEVLYINPEKEGYVIWHTPSRKISILFADCLEIPNGQAYVPALLWKASKERLHIYALKAVNDLTEEAPLFHAPFFNIYENGNVCMGTVDINISNESFLEDFIGQWQEYFFNSYFSHLIQDFNPLTCGITELWRSLVNTNKKFPVSKMKRSDLTIKDLIQ